MANPEYKEGKGDYYLAEGLRADYMDTEVEVVDPGTTDTDVRTYEIKQGSERFRIDIPANFKVTFGPLTPGSKFGSAYALRVYESDTKQRAVFVDVTSFRDLSIPYRKYVKNTRNDSHSEHTDKKDQASSVTVRSDEWIPVND